MECAYVGWSWSRVHTCTCGVASCRDTVFRRHRSGGVSWSLGASCKHVIGYCMTRTWRNVLYWRRSEVRTRCFEESHMSCYYKLLRELEYVWAIISCQFWMHSLDSNENVGELNIQRNNESGRLKTAWLEIGAHIWAGMNLEEDYIILVGSENSFILLYRASDWRRPRWVCHADWRGRLWPNKLWSGWSLLFLCYRVNVNMAFSINILLILYYH